MTARLRLLVAGLACVVVAAVVAVVVTDPFSSSPSSSSPAGSPAPRVSSTVNPALAPRPPASGAYFGAFVGPDVFTQANEVLAVERLQGQLGRKLAIVHTYLKWQAPFPTSSALTFLDQGSMLLISWAGTDTRQIVSGADDAWIRTRARQIKALGKPVFLEWRWEMDRPNLRSQVHSGAEYVAAWDHIRAVFAAVGVRNAAWVWCPTANGFSDGQAAAFYPGDNEVDWICADAYPAYGSTASFGSTVTAFLGWAAHYDKPVMIGEFGVPEKRRRRPARPVAARGPAGGAGRPPDQGPAVLRRQPGREGPQGSYSLAGDAAALSAFRAIAAQPYFNPAVTG